jgi:hypothetical protein
MDVLRKKKSYLACALTGMRVDSAGPLPSRSMLFLSAHWTGSYEVFNDLVQLPFDPVYSTSVKTAETESSCGGGGIMDGAQYMIAKLANSLMFAWVSDETIQRKIK